MTYDLEATISEMEILQIIIACNRNNLSEVEKQKHIARFLVVLYKNQGAPLSDLLRAYKEKWGLS